ncbi:MAG: hypothetical protein L0Z73_09880 [Gammaproteobacteria bacterium]|nr:hypothetical protein [Gammaproteobacteria bacterium]
MTKSQWKGYLLAMVLCTLAIASFQSNDDVRQASVTIIGDPVKLQQRYQTWKNSVHNSRNNHQMILNLVAPTSHTGNAAKLNGHVQFDFAANTISAQITGQIPDHPLELWVTNGASLFLPVRDDKRIRKIGAFSVQSNTANTIAKLQSSMDVLLQNNFTFDQVAVVPADSTPLQDIVLAASTDLFQKLYASEHLDSKTTNGFQLISTANASVPTGFPGVFNDLVSRGEDLFFNETFAGNGRSCGACHPATNNFTIDPAFIATLPPNDPLFVAEFIPALIFGNPANLDENGRPQRFENPVLMRAFGLIVENVDGTGDLQNRFTMRSVPHNIGMTVSLTTPPNGLNPPAQRTGWSGDGAPSGIVGGIAASGRLRDFILGAIVQHYPLTPARRFDGPAPDFRAPTVDEIDALEAFMLSIGRQQELDLNSLTCKDPGVDAGKILFRDGNPPGSVTCNNCHGNAGANVQAGNNPGNRNFNTGIELFLRNRLNDPNITVIGEPRPVDGGFGTNPSGDFTTLEEQPVFINENFGNQTFNTVSLVEAADSAPFFHNNIIANLEDAITFYNSPEFAQASGNSIPFNAEEVTRVANFLRVINALDNIENLAMPAASRAGQALALDPNPDEVIHRILLIAIADTQDAIDVLNEGDIHNSGGLPDNAVKQLSKAVQSFQQVMNIAASDTARNIQLSNATTHLNNAVSLKRL